MSKEGKPKANTMNMSSLTPKAIIHQKYGDKACYKVEEVQVLPENGCPGIAITQKAPPCQYRCTLHLPETTFVSDTFKKKRDAEQSAAEKAVEKLGLRQKQYNPTVQEAWDDLAGRVAFLFAEEFLSSPHPLSNHFRAASRREGHFNGFIPVSVIAIYDTKSSNICKFITPAAEANSLLVMSLVSRAASKLTDLVMISDDQLSLRRINSYPLEVISSINHEISLSKSIQLEVVCIPVLPEKDVEALKLNISATGYYLDVIACALGLPGASDIIISRTIGKASSEMRIYSSAPKHLFENLSEPQANEASQERDLNIRASYFAGQEIYGDAIMASVGYAWKSTDLSHEAISLCSYYRFLVSKIPSGAYKVSRDAILAAQLPLAFTTKSNWRGSFPRDILCAFCRSHHLSEPIFSTQSSLLDLSVDLPGSLKKLKATQLSNDVKSEAVATGNRVAPSGVISCNIKIYSKNQELLLECSPQESYRKQMDALQSVALKVLCWLDIFFEKPDLSAEELGLLAKKFDIQFTHDFFKGFSLCHSMHSSATSTIQAADTILNDIEGQNSGVTPANGSLACISYTVSLFGERDNSKEYLESCEEFEFEVGNQAVLPHLDATVEKMTVGQSAYFTVESPLNEYILAASGDSAELLYPRSCKLEYCVTLLQVTEPFEDRMEQALFSPPLSKQRVEFAVRLIRESSAASLVDFGCGSGSLLDSLLAYPTTLEKIVGVDLSQRSLAKAAKSLHSKLNSLFDPNGPTSKMKSAVMYYGNITKFDPQLHGFDIGTCLEVIEHMKEEEAWSFGNIVLSSFTPKILIVSTPNYEYNVILQGCTPHGQEDDPDEKHQAQACKFRNHDHKFEWTRAQFEHWASELAVKHNYNVEFSGVGGAADVEPGFASQIAIFRRCEESVSSMECGSEYVQIWKWSRDEHHLVNSNSPVSESNLS